MPASIIPTGTRKADSLSGRLSRACRVRDTLQNTESKGAEHWQEFGDVEYRRVFSVPKSIDVSKVNAELKDGTLKLHLPKAEAAKPRTIEIKSA